MWTEAGLLMDAGVPSPFGELAQQTFFFDDDERIR